MKPARRLVAPLLSVALSLAAPAGATEPWADPDPASPPKRLALSDIGVRGGAEYRAQLLYVNPISLNSVADRRIGAIDHRLRLDLGVDYKDLVRLNASVDALSGVLWGDNGDLDVEPRSTSGANVNTRNVNTARPCVGYREGDPLTADAYGYALCPADDWFVRRAYGDVLTPIGLLRVGRQPFTQGMGTAVADGDGRTNRFGVSGTGNNVDGVMFATKPLEAFVPKDERDTAEDRGLFLILRYDRLVTDNLRFFADDLHNVLEGLRYLAPRHPLGQDLELRLVHTYRWDDRNGTGIHAVNFRGASRFGRFSAGLDATLITGKTREVSSAYHVINNDPIVDQDVLQFGARAVARYDADLWTAYLEFDYASGDSDPETRSSLTQFFFAQDANVGLLLFEQVLAFQTARAAAAGVELLTRLGAPSLPADTISTQGAFTNAIAVFPQLDVRPHPNILLRGGALIAWAAEPTVDPAASLSRKDGARVDDDAVNYVGGKPGSFYGVELDARAQWRLFDHFAFDLEGAVLFPGDALQDENADAVHSFLAQGRTTFFF
jgi:hypothetical protein